MLLELLIYWVVRDGLATWGPVVRRRTARCTFNVGDAKRGPLRR